jgi:hypothetical protein
VHYASRCVAVDEQDDIAPPDKLIGQPLPGRLMHPGTAVQSDDRGKRTRAIGLGQIALDAFAQDERARKEPLRGAFKLDGLQRRGACISHQRTYGAAKRQHDRGLESDCSGHCRLPRMCARSTHAGATLLRRLDTCCLDQFGIVSDFLLDKSAELLRAHRQRVDAKACELLGRFG